MKFNINDKVRVVADEEKLAAEGLEDLELIGQEGVIHSIEIHGEGIDIAVEIGKDIWSFEEEDLELVEEVKGEVKVEVIQDGEIRTFDTGATRDTDEGKLDYVKALSPIVLRRYVQYLDKHRKQPDGSYRTFDNWKKGIKRDVYLSSLGRHFVDMWLLAQGHTTKDNHGPVDIEDALAAIIFNASGYLYEILKAKEKE